MFASFVLTLARMANRGANYDYNYNYNHSSGQAIALGATMFLILGLIFIPLLVLMLVSTWKVFEKAGKPGWAALIPVYNGWVLAEVGGKPGWWALIGLGGIIPLLGIPFVIAAFVLNILISIGVARNFGKDDAFAVLLVLVPIVGYPMLAFGKNTYKPVANVSKPSQPAA